MSSSVDEHILRSAKEIIVKFIETGRVSPTTFHETFKSVYNTIEETVKGVKNTSDTEIVKESKE